MRKDVNYIVRQLVEKYKTNDPFEIAAHKNIEVRFSDLGQTLGFFFSCYRTKFIHIHQSCNKSKQRFICAHELGHAVLHPHLNTSFMKRISLFNVHRVEMEANTFAMQLLLYNTNMIEGETKEQFCLRNDLPLELAKLL